jgi:putative hydrolase of the HAD superfamily
MIELIAFDADDTLWHNETLFNMTHGKFGELLADYHGAEWVHKKMFETEMRNLKYYGYGIKGFTLSMIETAIELTAGRIQGSDMRKILDFARQMLTAPVELLEHAASTIETLAASYPLMIITKGDLFEQESKIARSGLSEYFKYIEIRTGKPAKTYKTILKKLGVLPGRFLMVGNSLKSDILPVLEIGAYGVFIPYPFCWEHEKVTEADLHYKNHPNYKELEHIGLLPRLVGEL